MISAEIRDLLLKRFPKMLCAFGYGSGVIPQLGYDYTKEV
jgi:hypothetical protein